MKLARSHLPFVLRAEELASQLRGVERNAFLSLVADFLSDPRSEPARLRRTLELLGKDGGGHLDRSQEYGDQVRAVIRVLPAVLGDPDLPVADLRTVLGWTARLLRARRPAGGGRREPGPVKLPSGSPHRPPYQAATKPPRRPLARPALVAPPLPVIVAPEWKPRLQGLGWGNAGQIVRGLLADFEGEVLREAASAAIERLGAKELRKKKDLTWVQDLFAAAEGKPRASQGGHE